MTVDGRGQPGDPNQPPRDHLLMHAIAERITWRAEYDRALIAGGTQWLYSFRDTIPVLAENHTVYAVDLPGQGYTEAAEDFSYTFSALADAIGVFLDAVGLEKVSLVGHSWRGAWSLSFVERHPERIDKVVLMDSPGLAKELASQTALFDVPVVGEVAVKLMRRADFETSLRSAFARQNGSPRRWSTRHGPGCPGRNDGPPSWPFDILGLPELALPIGFGETGLPAGAILGGQPFAEDRLLSIAAAYQSVTDWHRRRPADPSPLATRAAARYMTAEEAAATME